MIRALIFAAFVAGISARKCIPQAPRHRETGDELCRVLLKDLADVEIQAANISRESEDTPFRNLNFFTQVLVTITADNTWLENLTNGKSKPTGYECVGVNARIGFDLNSIRNRASVPVDSPVCPPTSGPALAQYTLQMFGHTLTALINPPCAGSSKAPPTGKWGKYVKSLNEGMAAVQKVIASRDSANCAASTKKLGNGLKGILEAGGYTSVNLG